MFINNLNNLKAKVNAKLMIPIDLIKMFNADLLTSLTDRPNITE